MKKIQDFPEDEINTMIFKALNVFAPNYLSQLFIRTSDSHLLAHRHTSTDLLLQRKTATNGYKFFLYRGVKSWNYLPLEVKQASSIMVFKAKQEYIFLFIFFSSSFFYHDMLIMICFSIFYRY